MNDYIIILSIIYLQLFFIFKIRHCVYETNVTKKQINI